MDPIIHLASPALELMTLCLMTRGGPQYSNGLKKIVKRIRQVYFSQKVEGISWLMNEQQQQQQQQLKKLGIISYYLDQFNHNRSLHTPRARSQTASQSGPLERATLLPGLSPGYVWLCSHTAVVY
jgi:hypothetical protein